MRNKFLVFVTLIVIAIVGLFLYKPKGITLRFGTETPTSPSPNDPLLYCERIIGTWIAVGNSVQLEFKDSNCNRGLDLTSDWGDLIWNARDTTLSYPITYKYHFYSEFTQQNMFFYGIEINWSSVFPYVTGPGKKYFCGFKDDNTLILTDVDNGEQFTYIRNTTLSKTENQRPIRMGPQSFKISGQVIGLDGNVLKDMQVKLERAYYGPWYEVAIKTTDSTGKYEFDDIEPVAYYRLTFKFGVTDSAQIPEGAYFGSPLYPVNFTLHKNGLEITAMSDSFMLNGFNDGYDKLDDQIVIDFVYPSSPPVTVTPTPTIIPTVTPTVLATSTPTVGTFNFTVPANAEWFDTGIDIQAGQHLTFSASGTINLRDGDPNDNHTPNGESLCQVEDDCLISGAPYGKLIGRIWGGGLLMLESMRALHAPFEIGTNLDISSTIASGRLYLAVNDKTDSFADNTGSYQVTLTIR